MTEAEHLAETELDFPREWIEFRDPDNSETLIRADTTWLLSRWTCIFGNGCPGIDAEQPEDGCCLHGAYFTDTDDERRVKKIVRKLTPQTWQNYRRKTASIVEDVLEGEDGEEEHFRKTTTVDGACIFHNRPGFEGGTGCALHAQALRDGVHPLEYKPEVCWQVPIKRDFSTIEHADETVTEVTWIGEFNRRAWGSGGHEFDWWCTTSPQAHVGAEPLYRSYEPELVELIGRAAYDVLADMCAQREKAGQAAQHPATRRALSLTPVHRD